MLSSAAILERFRRDHAKDINLTLRPAYRELLEKLGNPHQKLPPVFHVAGTNGKGSTCAFLRAVLEAAGYKVHVYTSPHLVRFHERIRVAGELIREEELASILEACEKASAPGAISYFEAGTAAAFVAFARHPADFTILETGLGGRLDATNVVDKPLATIITRLSYDHREYLGDTLKQIAREKAGIMRAHVPCFTAHQPDLQSLNTLRDAAKDIKAPLYVDGKEWKTERIEDGFRFTDEKRSMDLPLPALMGMHQFQNAGLAIAALSVLPKLISPDAIAHGLQNVEWPARLQKLGAGALFTRLPEGWEVWLDGGHNDSAGEVLAAQAKLWQQQDDCPLYLIVGMLATKQPQEFVSPLAPYVAGLHTVPIPDEALSFSADDLATAVRAAGIKNVNPSSGVQEALSKIIKLSSVPTRILICGSLYLAGDVLREKVEFKNT